MTENDSITEPPEGTSVERSEANRLARVLTWLLRLVLVVLIGAFLGAGVYLGVPALLSAAVEPVEQNRARIEQLEAELERRERQEQRDRRDAADELADLQGRVTQLGERIAELEAGADSMQDDLRAAEERHDELAVLAEDVRALEREVEELQRELQQAEAAQRGPEERLDRLAVEVHRLRAMHLIVQAREALAAERLDEAANWTERARGEVLAAIARDEAAGSLPAVAERLQLARQALEENDNPAAADRDLQTAWEMLITEPGLSTTVTPLPTATQGDEGADE